MNADLSESDVFVLQQNRGNRKQTSQPKQRGRPSLKPSIGTGKVMDRVELGAITKTKWIFVSRFETSTKKEAVSEYVSGLCEGKTVICEELKTRYVFLYNMLALLWTVRVGQRIF